MHSPVFSRLCQLSWSISAGAGARKRRRDTTIDCFLYAELQGSADGFAHQLNKQCPITARISAALGAPFHKRPPRCTGRGAVALQMAARYGLFFGPLLALPGAGKHSVP